MMKRLAREEAARIAQAAFEGKLGSGSKNKQNMQIQLYKSGSKQYSSSQSSSSQQLLSQQQQRRISDLFVTSITHAKTDQQRNLILIVQGQCNFNSRNYGQAVEKWGKSGREFEETALSLMRLGRMDILRQFVDAKLHSLGANEKIAASLLGTWIVGLYLDRIAARAVRLASTKALGTKGTIGGSFRSYIDEKGFDMLCDFAEAIGDTKTMVEQFISRGMYKEAIDILYIKDKAELFYEFSPSLIIVCPKNGKQPLFDIRYALRVCIQEKCPSAATYLYIMLGLYQEAVELALTVSFDLAKETARLARGRVDPALFQRIWVRITESVVSRHMKKKEQGNISQLESKDGKDNKEQESDEQEEGNKQKGINEKETNKGEKKKKKSLDDQVVSSEVIREILDECMTLHSASTSSLSGQYNSSSSNEFQLALVDILPCLPDFSCVDELRGVIDDAMNQQEKEEREKLQSIEDQAVEREHLRNEEKDVSGKKKTIQAPLLLCRRCKQPLSSPPTPPQHREKGNKSVQQIGQKQTPSSSSKVASSSLTSTSYAQSILSSTPSTFQSPFQSSLQSQSQQNQFTFDIRSFTLLPGIVSFPCSHSFHADCALQSLFEDSTPYQQWTIAQAIQLILQQTNPTIIQSFGVGGIGQSQSSSLVQGQSGLDAKKQSLIGKYGSSADKQASYSTNQGALSQIQNSSLPLSSNFASSSKIAFLSAPLLSSPHIHNFKARDITAEMKELLASDCPVCGEAVVNTASLPFFSDGEAEARLFEL
ncbi:MAG: hypothetical protein EZS28_001330 [Streblomastix strix]|uniref:RING-type domain-containing protein n=1 Tax=Streblomastix strix TaxID=222440 RepID=A0A5J4X8F4_9EUKA|nr:MAG: hypothetical protein EZS28_001330 [Streblomastix strix]